MKENQQVNQQIEILLARRSSQGMDEQITEARQIVNEIDTIDSRQAFAQVEKRIQQQTKRIPILNILTRVAAILFVPLLAVSFWLYQKQPQPAMNLNFAMQEITSPPGVRSQIVLPDGSNVWLNAESTIRFKVPFDPESRDIAMTGEAYFEVKKDTQRPFQVESGKVKVKVLGTHFNCKAYKEDMALEVVLVEGKVTLNTSDSSVGEELVLKPGERAVIDKITNSTSITTENPEKYIAWHKGKLVFDETAMPDVALQLERWFGVDVEIHDPKILSYRITTTFENEPLHQVLELLALSSPIRINYIAAKMSKENQIQSKAKVIITRKI